MQTDARHESFEHESFPDQAGVPEDAQPQARQSVLPDDGFAQLEAQHASGANWFYWIAALSLVNAVILLSGGDMSFIIGLGVTQLISAVAVIAAQQADANTALVITAVGFVMALGVAGVVVLFGMLAKRRYVWAFVLGMGLYFFDGLLFLLFQDLLSVAFHVFVLFMLFGGLTAARKLNALELQDAPAAYAD